MVEIYLSGTGNTKYCIEKLVSLIHSSAKVILRKRKPSLFQQFNKIMKRFTGYPTCF